MVGVTSPDLLRFPNDVNQPADSPNALQQLATDTQAGLSKRMPIIPTTTALTLEPGWVNNTGVSFGGFVLYKMGQLVVARGMLRRSTVLTVVDNTLYQMATVPVAYQPVSSLRMPAAWVATVSGGIHNYMATQVELLATGELSLLSNVAGTMSANSDYVSIAGLSWITA